MIHGGSSQRTTRLAPARSTRICSLVAECRHGKAARARANAPATRATVLLPGESGTGKEVLARRFTREPAARQAVRRVNCAAIPRTLLESELFGHERGAFTGALQEKPGLFEAADGGTVFLDEIGDMPLPLQTKLLRVLQDARDSSASAAPRTIAVDVRIIAATNRDLEPRSATALPRGSLLPPQRHPAAVPPLRDAARTSRCSRSS